MINLRKTILGISKIVGYFLFFSIFISCNENKETNSGSNCKYTLDDFYHTNDSSKFIRIKTKDFVEILDSDIRARGCYRFDSNGLLRFYCFLWDSTHQKYSFGIDYDSLGNQVDTPPHKVVVSITTKIRSDSLVLSFYLYAVHYSYKNIQLIGPGYEKSQSLFISNDFSNLIFGRDTIINTHKKVMFYITGNMINNCSQETKNFTDSLYVYSP